MAKRVFPDEWLIGTIEGILPPGAVEGLRGVGDGTQGLWELACAKDLATDEQILEALSQRYRIKIADLTTADQSAKELMTEAIARRYHVVPLRMVKSRLEVATSNPTDMEAEDALRFATGREVRLLLASPTKIRALTDRLYRPDDMMQKVAGDIARPSSEGLGPGGRASIDRQLAVDDAGERPIVRLVDLILSEGIHARASDIHIEPEEEGVIVRYRIDGVLRQVMKVPLSARLPLVSRIKILSSLDIADKLRPQDGRARVAIGGMPVDLRVSTLPASHGEKVVIRVLDTRGGALSLEALGLSPDELETFHRALRNHEGIILVTGPTGSGKTTTLYSALRSIQSGETNIVTVEDPVEYRLPGIVQVQVHDKAGLTFANALRSILRQDPDVVLIGEIRDRETAEIAVQASLTGHLVLSTLHTNDAATAVTRLVDVGIEPYKISAALRAVFSQRLMRRLCPQCKEVWTDEVPDRLTRWVPSGTALYRSVGCSHCAMTGFRGRFSIIEVLTVTPAIERVITGGALAERIVEAARAEGMKSLWDSGVGHVVSGETTVEELLRVVDLPAEISIAEHAELKKVVAGSPAARPRAAGRGLGRGVEVGSVAAPAAPLGVGDLEEAGVDVEPLDLLEEGELVAQPLSRLNRRVLLVEDEDLLRRVMKDLLEREGYIVGEARDGVQALDQVDRVAPDVMVLDLNLPGLDGYGVLQHLRSRPATAQLPVLVLTAKGDEDNEVRVFQLGADDFVTKPFRARSLAARLEALFDRRRLA